MKPILFNAEMVRAILEGRKMVTRRIVKPQLKRETGKWDWRAVINEVPIPYRPGDILYVRETWRLSNPRGDYKYGTRKADLEYKADGHVETVSLPRAWEKYLGNKWRPSIHMPKEMTRAWIKVTGVGVERIQDISPEQLRKEGLRIFATPGECKSQFNKFGAIYDFEEKKKEFEQLWDSTIKGKGQELSKWESNPWVWVIEFVRCDKEGKELG